VATHDALRVPVHVVEILARAVVHGGAALKVLMRARQLGYGVVYTHLSAGAQNRHAWFVARVLELLDHL
jgi:hypothetical protein